jgi:hypothetical protein
MIAEEIVDLLAAVPALGWRRFLVSIAHDHPKDPKSKPTDKLLSHEK